MLALQLADDRLINGVNVGIKPAKVFLSLSLQMATLAWGLALVESVTHPHGARYRPLAEWPLS